MQAKRAFYESVVLYLAASFHFQRLAVSYLMHYEFKLVFCADNKRAKVVAKSKAKQSISSGAGNV